MYSSCLCFSVYIFPSSNVISDDKSAPLKSQVPVSPLKVCFLLAENEHDQFIIAPSQMTANFQPSGQ